MLFLSVLGVFYATTWTYSRRLPNVDRWRVALAGGMVVAGVAHIVDPTPFVQHLPTWVPWREPLVLLSGVAEIALGAALLTPQPLRRYVGLLLAVFLVAVYPANVFVAVMGVEVDGQPGGIYPWLRLLVQPVFVWLAVWSTRDAGTGDSALPSRGALDRVDRAGAMR